MRFHLPSLCLVAVLASESSAQTLKRLFPGFETETSLGSSVAPIGDFDGDGVLDFVLGAPDDNVFSFPLFFPDRGSVRILSGATGESLYLFPTDSSEITGPGRLGTSLCRFDEGGLRFAAGSPNELSGSIAPGKARLFGSGFFQPFGVAETYVGSQDGEAFGTALAKLPPMLGGSNSTLAVGAPRFDKLVIFQPTVEDVGRVDLFDAGTQTLLLSFEGAAAGDRLGSAICSAGDVDLDGNEDIAVGAPGGGYVRIYGSTSIFGFGVIRVYTGGPSFGSSIVSLGDVDGGGVPDLAIGEPQFGIESQLLPRGRVTVIRGEDGSVLHTNNGSLLAGGLGGSLAAVDLELDGALEFASIDRNLFFGVPRVRVFDGLTGAPVGSYQAWPMTSGAGLANMGDFDGDGGEDLAVGLPRLENGEGGALIFGQYFGPPGGGPPQTYTVDDDGPADFDSIAIAALSVGSGSTLLIRNGDYYSFTLDRGISLIAEPLLGPFTNDRVDLPELHVAGTGELTLSGLRLDRLTLDGVAGRAVLDDLDVFPGGTRIVNCTEVTISKLSSGADTAETVTPRAGLEILSSRVHLSRASLHGGDGPDSTFLSPGTDGAPGLLITGDSQVWMSRSFAGGGAGGDGSSLVFLGPGDGGPGARVSDDAYLDLRGGSTTSPLAGGLEGFVFGSTQDQAADLDVQAPATAQVATVFGPISTTDPAQVTVLGDRLPTLTVTGQAELGATVVASIDGDAGDFGVLLIARDPFVLETPGVLGVPLWVDLASLSSFPLYTVPGATTPASIALPIPPVPALSGAVFHCQALTVRPDFLYDGSNGDSIPILF